MADVSPVTIADVRAEYDGRLAVLTRRADRLSQLVEMRRGTAQNFAASERERRSRDPAARAAEAVAAARRRRGR